MKYAHLENNTNKLLGWYLEKDKGRIEVSDKVWQDALTINANCYENGAFIVKDFRTAEELEQIRTNTINRKASDIILSKYPLEKQSSAQLSIYGDEYLATMKVFIADIIKQSNELEADSSKTAEDFVVSNIGGK